METTPDAAPITRRRPLWLSRIRLGYDRFRLMRDATARRTQKEGPPEGGPPDQAVGDPT
jgi:hypothetical protein